MERATLHIERTDAGLRFTLEASGPPLVRARSVHPDDLSAACSALDAAPSSSDAVERLGARLFSRLWERDIREALFRLPPAYLTLHTHLPAVPWEATFDGGRFLADAHAVGRAPAAAPPPAQDALAVLMVANPTGDLPFSESEAAMVVQRLRPVARIHVTTLSGAAATRDAILEALETRPFDVIHFSCHAEHAAAAPCPGVIRAYDGPVTAEDIYQTALVRPPALCVLNACESGRCAGPDAVSGLATAFHAAGAAAVIGASWPVNNKSAGHWMSVLYAGLASGETVGRAMREARAETRRVFAQDPLVTWAAYTLHGAPDLRIAAEGNRVRLGWAPLIGRETEWRALDDAWQKARTGVPSLAVLLGGPDSGKTRLLQQWLSARPNATVLSPPWAEGGAADAQRLSGAVEAVLDAAAHGPVLMACDPLEDAPDWAWEWLSEMFRAGRGAPLMVVGTLRDAAPLAALPREGTACVALAPLRGDALCALFRAFDADPPPGLREAPAGEAERLALGLPGGAAAGALSQALPEDQRGLLRCAAVLGQPFQPDHAAALRGQDTAALWRPLDALLRAGWLVECASGAFDFRQASDRAAVLDAFTPATERQALCARAAGSRMERREYGEAGRLWNDAGEPDHARAAFRQAFFQAHAAGAWEDALRWADALCEGGDAPADAAFLAARAEASAHAGRWEQARHGWEAALPNLAGPERARALARLAEAALQTGATDAAESRLDEAAGLHAGPESLAAVLRAEIRLARHQPAQALAFARAAAETAREPDVRRRALSVQARAHLLAAEAPEAIRVCAEALAADAAAGPYHDAVARVLAQARQYAGEYAAAEDTLAALMDRQRAAHRPHDRAATLLAMAELWRDQGRLEPALTALDEAAALATRSHVPAVMAEVENVRSSVLRRQGRYALAMDAAALAAAIARQADLTTAAIRATIHSATLLAEQGELAAACVAAEKAIGAAVSTRYAFGEAWARTIMGVVHLERGDASAAHPWFEDALGRAHAIHGHIGVASARYYLGWTCWHADSPDPGLFREAERAAARIAYRAVQHPAAFGAALCAGDVDASERALKDVEALNMGAVAAWLRVRRGPWRWRRGDEDGALRDLTSGYRVARRLGLRALQAAAAGELAGVYAAQGEPMADTLRAEADDLARQCLAGWPGA